MLLVEVDEDSHQRHNKQSPRRLHRQQVHHRRKNNRGINTVYRFICTSLISDEAAAI